METILVTGGAGFIGSHVCERLIAEGKRVICIDNFNDYYNPSIKRNNIIGVVNHKNYELCEADIRDKDALNTIFCNNSIDKIIHLAAIAGVRNSVSNPLEYVDVNIKGTINFLELSKEFNVKRFLLASSSSVYGMNSKTPFSEDDRVDLQVSPYAASKRAAELYCATYSSMYNLSIACLRFFTVYGPRQRPEMAIHLFTRLIDEGKEIPVFGDGTSSRDYTYIDDIVDGIEAALENECGFEIFNLGNCFTVTLMQLIETLENKLKKKAKIRPTTFQVGDVQTTYADITKSKKVLGYRPKVQFQEGIEKFITWYKNNIRNV